MKKYLLIRRFLILASLLLLIPVIQKIDWQSTSSTECPFCEINNLQKHLVYQGAHASILTTYKPAVPGHLLLIPNRHVKTFDQLNSEEVQEIGELVKKVHLLYKSRFQATDYLLIQKNGPLAGQSVPHVHIHILPRTKDISMVSFIFRFLIVGILKPYNEHEMDDYRRLVHID